MKDLKSIFTQNFLISAITCSAILGFMTLPFLEGTRNQAASALGGNSGLLWGAAIALLLGIQFFCFRRILSIVARPINRLVRDIEHGEQGFAFRTKAKSKEEDSLKHAIESTNLRAREAREQADDLENELELTQARLERAETKTEELTVNVKDYDKACRELRVENESLKASKAAVQLSLENERKSKVGIEVEKRTEEIYTQMERAISAAAYKSIWLPSVVHELKVPISIIQEISNKLNETWTQSSISQVSEELSKIQKQSLTQLELLEDILSRNPQNNGKPASQAPETPVNACPQTIEETPTSPSPKHDEQAQETETTVEEKPALALETPSEPEREAVPITETPMEASEVHTPEPEVQEVHVFSDFAMPQKPEAEKPRKFEQIEVPAILEEKEEATTKVAAAAPQSSPYDLKNLLNNLVNEFSLLAPDDVVLSYAIDEDLEIEIEDENLLNLLHTLTDTAVTTIKRGDVVIGIELQKNSIIFDLACDGELRPHPSPMSLNKAEQCARALKGQIEVESSSPNELHLSFEYVFDQSSIESPVFDLEN